MKEIRPLGSEKLQGDDKIKRILEIANYQSNSNNKKAVKDDFISENTNGVVYGIVREKDGYYVKKGINESSLDYIGGMYAKNRNKFSSYNEALKKLKFIEGQEALNETKYRLVDKKNNAKSEMPAAEPVIPEPAAAPPVEEVPPIDDGLGGDPTMASVPADDMGGDPGMEGVKATTPTDDGMGDEDMGDEDMGGQEDDPNLRSSYMEEIQKFSGKLGQELRDQRERLESDDLKYVLNMIISAINLDSMDSDDLDDIADKFKSVEPGMDDMGDGMGGESDLDVPMEAELGEQEEPELEPRRPQPERPQPERRPENTGAPLDISQFADIKEDGEGNDEFSSNSVGGEDMSGEIGGEGMREFDQPGWLQSLWNSNPGIAEKAEADMKRALGFEVEEESSNKFNGDGEDHMDGTGMSELSHDMPMDEADEEEVELDLDEIKREINNSVNGTLSKYFK